MITNEQLAALRDNKDYIMIIGPRGVGRRAWKWEQLRHIDRKYCDIDYQREYDEIQEDLRRAYEQGGNINVKLYYDRG
jgi:hypothetical protein